MAGRSGSRGFTLIEALVALTVTAISLAAIGQLAHSTFLSQVRTESEVAALTLARGLVAAPASRTLAPEVSGEQGALSWRVAPERALGAPASGWTPVLEAVEVDDARGAKVRVELVRLKRATPK